jgi:CRISPR-associated protein Cas5t
MEKVLEIKFLGWTATPRMPFVLSGNAVCMSVPSYSLLLGMLGCCLGRNILPNEAQIGFHYAFDSVGVDLEKRQRLEFDGRKVKTHSKGGDAYRREFHVAPRLTVWLSRLDWEDYFRNPLGTPSLGRSQDILKIVSVRQVEVEKAYEVELSGCMLPFSSQVQAGGQLMQLAEAYEENEEVGAGRSITQSRVFIAIPHDSVGKVTLPNLYRTIEKESQQFYLHFFKDGN